MFSGTFDADVKLDAGSRLPMPDHEDRGIYIVEGSISVAGQDYEASQMMVFRPGDRITLAAGGRGARLIILGGATLGGPRYIWRNFVSSRLERIEQAKGEWAKGRFDTVPGDVEEFIPLPDTPTVRGARRVAPLIREAPPSNRSSHAANRSSLPG